MAKSKLRDTFTTPYEQFSYREGQKFTLIGPSSNMDSEVGSMYLVKFEDGVEIEVWPEEIYDHTDNTVYDMKKLKTASKNQFNKSDRMFNYCWYIFWRDCDPPSCIEDVMEALNNIATKQVNDPNSSFYIYGE